jgi:hypothetical protein
MAEEDRQPTPTPAQKPSAVIAGKAINPYLLGAGFLAYCERQGWVATQGSGAKKRYYLTEKGEIGLKSLGIEL